MAVSGYGAMSELVEARDIDGQLYVPVTNLADALNRARKNGAEAERIRLMAMMTPHERRMAHVRDVCEQHGVSVKEVLGKSKLPKIVEVRQILFWDFREDGMSFPEIGRFFGRDHTTVISGMKQAMKRAANEA